MNPITSFNIKADLKNHPLIYGSVALLALAAIAMSVVHPDIAALRSINRYIFLGIGGGLVGLGLVGLRIRNCHGYYRFTDEQFSKVESILRFPQKLPVLLVDRGNQKNIYYLNQSLAEVSCIGVQADYTVPSRTIIEKALLLDTNRDQQESLRSDEDLSKLENLVRPEECLKYRLGRNEKIFALSGRIIRMHEEFDQLPSGRNIKTVTLPLLRLRQANEPKMEPK